MVRKVLWSIFEKGVLIFLALLIIGALTFAGRSVYRHIFPGEPPVEVIRYQRSGGLHGIDEQWIIYDDGSMEGWDLNTGKSVWGHVEAHVVADLLELIENGGFFSLAESYMPQTICCDRLTYRLSVRFPHPRCPDPDAMWKAVTVMDGAESPGELWQIIRALDNITPCVSKTIEAGPGR